MNRVKAGRQSEDVVGADLFISYAWTSGEHREWVRLLAAHLKAIGFDVLVDADVDYGDSLTGFMRRLTEARHVLMIADENYVDRADNRPDSGVGIENGWISGVHPDKPSTWLSVLFKDNPSSAVPAWLSSHMPRGHLFNANPASSEFPGSEQVTELWRWLQDLPSNRDNATPLATLRERAARLERIALQRDAAHWRDPALTGEHQFTYAAAPSNTYRMGYGEYEFAFMVDQAGSNTVHVYADPIQAVGLVRPQNAPTSELASHLTSGRTVDAGPGDVVVLMNRDGALCRVEIIAVQGEVSGPPYVAPSVDFRYEVITTA